MPKKEKEESNTNNEEKEVNDALAELNEEERKNNSFWKAAGIFILEVGKVIIISLAIILPIRYFLIQPFYVKGASMEPTFHDYEYLIINEISYRLNEPQRGDIVVLKDPRNKSQFFIKRVIGLPGERITIKEGKVIITNNDYPKGVVIDETDYLSAGIFTQGQENLELKSEEYYVLGDNRNSSLDSRIVGPIKQKEIIGKAWIRAWPFSKITVFEEPDYNFE